MILERKYQSHRYYYMTKHPAISKRHRRYIQEKQLHDMAYDRRRRWQRSNPYSGHYRPSYDRMKNAKNAIMYSS